MSRHSFLVEDAIPRIKVIVVRSGCFSECGYLRPLKRRPVSRTMATELANFAVAFLNPHGVPLLPVKSHRGDRHLTDAQVSPWPTTRWLTRLHKSAISEARRENVGARHSTQFCPCMRKAAVSHRRSLRCATIGRDSTESRS